MSGRSLHANAILGQELFSRLSQTKVLLVGAGGIGCELRACAPVCVCVALLIVRRAGICLRAGLGGGM